jgi:hypothetical protein
VTTSTFNLKLLCEKRFLGSWLIGAHILTLSPLPLAQSNLQKKNTLKATCASAAGSIGTQREKKMVAAAVDESNTPTAGVTCTKCMEPCTLAKSTATERNPLLRQIGG